MIIYKTIGTLSQFNVGPRTIETVWLEWFECGKRILHKKTSEGSEVVLKRLNENNALNEEDVVYEDDVKLIVIDIKPVEAIVLRPDNLYQMASLCYEVGNKHLPLFYKNDEVVVPYEAPLFKLLNAAGFKPLIQMRKLSNPLKTTVTPHGSGNANGSTLFSKIMKLTTGGNE